MAYTSVNYSLNHLVRLLSTPGLTFSKGSQVPMLKVELGFLRTFIWWMAKRCPQNGNLEGLLLQIDVVARNAINYHQSIPSDSVEDIAKDLNQLAPKVLHHTQLLKPEIEKAYIKAAKYSPPMPDKLVVEFINSLLDNLMNLLRNQDPSTFAAREELGALVTKLRFLRNLLSFAATRCTDHGKLKELSYLAEAIAIESACLSFMCSFDPKDGNKTSSIKDKLAELVRKIKPITPDIRKIYVGVLEALSPLTTETHTSDPDLASFIDSLQDTLSELQDDQPSWMALLKFNFDGLHHDLMFLSSFVEDPPTQFIESEKWDDPNNSPIQVLHGELRDWNAFDTYPFKHFTEHLALKGLLTHIQDLALKVGCTIFSFFYVDGMEEHKLVETETALVSLGEKIQLLKSEVGVPTFTMPEVKIVRVDDQGFIRSLSRNLRELLDWQSGSIDCLKRRLQRIADELEFLSSFIKDWGERRHKHEKLTNLATHMVTVAYRAEYVTDSLLVRDGTLFYHLLCLIDVLGEMKRIRREAIMVFHDKMTYVTEPEVVDSIRPSIDTTSLTMPLDVNDQLVVGLKDDMDRLRSRLVRGSKELDVIPIVGMGGLGKTTIARKLFSDRRIVHHFDCRSFVTVSQVYEPRVLVCRMLREVAGDDGTLEGRDAYELMDMLQKYLKGRRFLIVVDDLWSSEAWDDMRMLFPNSNNGSRILLTTRLREVANYTSGFDVVHDLRFLTDQESWELLEKKIFQQESCPPELEHVGKQIAEQCQGLPLMIVLIAGILARKKNNVDSWIQVCESIPIDKGEYLLSIIEQQYSDLPDYLRQCFLYFGAFPLDEEIPVSKLIRLWTAEGFVQEAEVKSFEDVGMDYLMDLIGRNLVMVCRRSSEGVVKSCKIHDRMHDLCCTKAIEEDFFRLIRYGEVSTPLGGIHDGVDPDYFNVPHSITCEHRRLFISSNWGHNISLEVSGPLVRSLVLGGQRSNFSRSEISYLYQNLIFLRVLDLEHVNVGDAFPIGLEKMALLRYLAVRGEMTSIPSSIISLQQLENFIITGLRGEVEIPDEIWNLTRLRHLHINDRASFGALDNRKKFSEKLPNLITMSTPCLSYGNDSEEMLRRLTSLKKLKCIILESWDTYTQRNMFPRLDLLFQLVSLKLIYHGRKRECCEFNFPSTLRRLTLSRFRLPWDQISIIGGLPNLEVLKLQNKAFEGSLWEVDDEGFPCLHLLRLDTLNLEEWHATSEPFPNLQRLELHNCKKLKEIPSMIGDIPGLEVIDVKWCSQSVEHSAMMIKEEQEDLGNEQLKVIIQDKE